MATNTLSLDRPQATRMRPVRRILDALPLVGLILLLVIMLFPFFMVALTSFKTQDEYNANGALSLPQRLDLSTIEATWASTDFSTKLVNSTVISLSVAVIAVVLSLLNAFALGIGNVKGSTVILIFFLMAMTLPPESLVYPLYYMFKQVGLYNTRISVILITAAFHSAYGTYLLSSVLKTFSRDLIEAARIDGCNKLQLLLRIVVPLNAPSLSVLFVFYFIWTWNDFFMPLIFLISNSKQTVPLAVALARSQYNTVVTTQSAAALLAIVPCVLFFVLFQRTLARGVTAGAIK